jgi:phage baseplate assembly protein W
MVRYYIYAEHKVGTLIAILLTTDRGQNVSRRSYWSFIAVYKLENMKEEVSYVD